MQTLEAENDELQEINGQLLQELEKRDQAVGEAVGLICELENKVERLEIALVDTRPSTAQPDTDYLSTDAGGTESASSPPQTNQATPRTPDRKPSPPKLQSRPSITPAVSSKLMSLATLQTSRTPIRTPSFLNDKVSSASALRSLYLAEDNQSNVTFSFTSGPRPGSLLSKDDDAQGPGSDTYTLNSPRLSVLSESSFLSVYGSPKGFDSENMKDELSEVKPIEEGFDESESRSSLKKQQRNARVDQWIQDRDTPSKASRTTRPHAGLDGQYSSIGEVLQTRPHLTDEEIWRASPQKGLAEHSSRKKHQRQVKVFESPSFGGPIFGTHVLPPTPDTLSADNQDSYNPSTPGTIAEKSLLDGTPGPARTYAALLPRHRPHTADGVGTERSVEPSRTFNTADDLEGMAAVEDGMVSTEVEHNEVGQKDIRRHYDQMSGLNGNSSRVSRTLGASSSTRPALKSYGVDTMFGGAGINHTSSSRTTSFPAATAENRRRSVHVPASEYQTSGLPRMETLPLSSQGWTSGGSHTATPSKSGYEAYAISSRNQGSRLSTSSSATQKQTRATNDCASNVSRSSSLRLRVPGVSFTPTPANRESLTSRLFGRSYSQTAPSTTDSLGDFSERSARSSKLARPGTAGNVEVEPQGSTFLDRTRSGPLYDDSTSSSTDGIVTPTTEQGISLIDLYDVEVKPSSTRTDSQQTVRGSQSTEGDEYKGSMGRKWGMGLGRTASLKIKEGFGRRGK